MKKIAIIGAGLSGLLLANGLKDKAHITVFEKARGVGGRMSTRYADPYYFDHGSQYFTAQSAEFQAFLQPFIANGTVQEWQGDVVTLNEGKVMVEYASTQPHYVAAPNMNSLCKKLAENIDVRLSVEIAPLGEKQPDGWHLHAKTGEQLGVFDWVISTAPPKQTVALFENVIKLPSPLRGEGGIECNEMTDEGVINNSPSPASSRHPLPSRERGVESAHQGCYTLMLGFNEKWQQNWKAAHIQNSPFELVTVNSTKPQRNKDVTCLVALSAADWAEAHIDEDMKAMELLLLPEFARATGINATPDFIALHRWRYATMDNMHEFEPFYNATHQLAAVSDWCSTSTIEAVWHNVQKLLDRHPGLDPGSTLKD